MSKDAEIKAKDAMLEDFGRFGTVEMLDSDPDITDETFDEAYAEGNAGA